MDHPRLEGWLFPTAASLSHALPPFSKGWQGRRVSFLLVPTTHSLGPDNFSSSSCRARALRAGAEQTLSMELVDKVDRGR